MSATSIPLAPRPSSLAPSWKDALLIAVLAPVLIAGCVTSDFLGYDDGVHYQHELMKPGVPLTDIWKPTPFSTYFPVTILSYRVDRWLYEGVLPVFKSPAPGVRLDSLILHVLAGLCLWRFLLAMGTTRWLAFFAAAGWVVHPAACESVCWISERKNVLAGLFGFASLWAYAAIPGIAARVCATAGLFALAMLSKPTAAGFLPVYILFDVLVASSSSSPPLLLSSSRLLPAARRNAWIAQGILYAALAALIVALAKVNIAQDENSSVGRAGGSLFTVALTDVPVLLSYIVQMVCPANLSIFYYRPIVHNLADLNFWLSLAALLLLFAGSLWISKTRVRTLFYWGWFVGALGPALNIIPIPYLMQDRFAYFALPALLLLVADAAVTLYTRLRPEDAAVRSGFLYALIPVLFLAGCALLRSGVFSNDLELFTDAVSKEPKSSYAQLYLALTQASSADILDYAGVGEAETLRATREQALQHCRAAQNAPDFERLLDPNRAVIIEGALLERLDQLDAAEARLRPQLDLRQKTFNYVLIDTALARVELKRAHGAVALKWVERGMKANDGAPSAELLYLKGECLELLRRFDEAAAAYRSIPQNTLAYARAQTRLLHMSTASAH